MDWMVIIQQQNQLQKVLETNQATDKFGLVLTKEDARLILEEQKTTLAQQKRVEFSESIIPKITYEFCDSDFFQKIIF